ncbi:vinculin-like isoform X1, partial [Brachionus plicatilis]
MPVFHTKTIESILEPIAQQISKLVILHEEADNGNSMPDLSLSLQVVRQAADNLIRVGRQTCETTEDSLLQKELPQALNQVKNACEALETASINLKSDSKSATGKRKLVEGERGILQGISAILLTLDESQVRKIVNSCKQVIEYLSITELIDKTDDLVTYIKNMTPVLAQMTREVDAREKELTNPTSRERLCEHLDQVKTLIPSFISSIKVVLILNPSIDTIDKQIMYFA